MASATKRGEAYTIRVSLGYDSTGKQIQKFATWKPASGMTEKQIEKELERQKVLFEEKCRSGRVLDGSISFSDFSSYWLEEYAEKQLRPSTIAGYRLMFRRINAAIGHIRLERLQPNHLMELYSNLQEGGIRADITQLPMADIKSLLKDRKLSQASIAERAGVSVSVVAATAHGKSIANKSAEKLPKHWEFR